MSTFWHIRKFPWHQDDVWLSMFRARHVTLKKLLHVTSAQCRWPSQTTNISKHTCADGRHEVEIATWSSRLLHDGLTSSACDVD